MDNKNQHVDLNVGRKKQANEANRRLVNYTEENKEITFCQNLTGAV
jgi:hypothetical protein